MHEPYTHDLFYVKFREKADVFCPVILEQAKDLFARIIPEPAPARIIYRPFTLLFVHPVSYIRFFLMALGWRIRR